MSIQTDDISPPRRSKDSTASSAFEGASRMVEPSVASPNEDAIERALRPKDLEEIGRAHV